MQILQTPSEKSGFEIAQTPSAQLMPMMRRFPLSWSHYVKLLSVQDPEARAFYETEALRGGWSVRPLVLEFLGLKDEYSESELEAALIQHLETFLLELGSDFTFVGRQRRLRIGDQWYRIDLLFYHRRLRCLVIFDLKLGKFTHADTGQMHLYLNYASENWTLPDENPPVGVILCAQKDDAVVHYALEGLPTKVLAAEYRIVLPDEEVLIAEVKRTQRLLEARKVSKPNRKP